MNLLLRFLLALVFATPAFADILGDLHKSFMERYDAANLTRDDQLKKLDASYLAALNRQVEKAKATGKLDAVIPFLDEVQAVKTAADPLPELPATASAELKQMRAKHADARAKILKSHAETVTSLADKMTAALKAQESELTKAGKIDEALAAKHMRESLEKDEKLRDSRDLIQFGGSSGLGRPAMQIRRYGDNLEVLVHYDRSGKITMDSPVSNVRERTEPSRELGDTTATTLGEFVGAKGSKVHRYVAFHQVFEGDETPGMSFTEIIPAHKTNIEGESGMALSFKADAKNPHVSLGPILPNSNQGGSARIHVRYFIPKENRALHGFQFVQNVGGPLGGKRFATQEKWIEESIEFDAAHEGPGLLFYLSCIEGKTIADAAGESIILGELRIEHTSFPAFLQKSIDSSGSPIDEVNDPAKQPQIIRNGVLLER